MDILKQLFERHFHSLLIVLQPLQGNLGGLVGKIIQLLQRQIQYTIAIQHIRKRM